VGEIIMNTEELIKTIEYKIDDKEITFPAKLTGMNWSYNELTLKLDDSILTKDIVKSLINSATDLSEIDFIVTLQYRT